MSKRRQRGLSAEQRAELWRRWKEGQSLSDIGRALDKAPGSVFGFLASRGGIAPPPRHRSTRALTAVEREEISRQVYAGNSLRSIAATIKRAPSTVSREIARNGGSRRYRAALADARASVVARRPKVCKLARHERLRCLVAEKLGLDWSPEQIAGWLRVKYPRDVAMRVSHETIYKSLFIQARGVLKRELQRHLRSRRTMRTARNSTTAGQQRGRIIDAVSIRDRPPEVAAELSMPYRSEIARPKSMIELFQDIGRVTSSAEPPTVISRRSSREALVLPSLSKLAEKTPRALLAPSPSRSSRCRLTFVEHSHGTEVRNSPSTDASSLKRM